MIMLEKTYKDLLGNMYKHIHCLYCIFNSMLRNLTFHYFNIQGEEISRSTDGCTGNICQSGQIIHWDDPCVIDPPFCPGTEEKLPGQCCPICHETTPPPPVTTPPPPTTTMNSDMCVEDGKIYMNGNCIY